MNKIKYFFKSILFLIIVNSNLSAFTFDKLESGYSFNRVLNWAQDNNMPLCVESYIFIPKGFTWKALQSKEKYRIFHYYDVIFNKKARIDLYFTQNSNELYKLRIRWDSNKELKETIISVLNKKYNSGKRVFSSSIGENILFGFKEWRPNSTTLIKLKNSGITGLFLTYTDLSYENNEYKEKERKKLEIIVKDANKF